MCVIPEALGFERGANDLRPASREAGRRATVLGAAAGQRSRSRDGARAARPKRRRAVFLGEGPGRVLDAFPGGALEDAAFAAGDALRRSTTARPDTRRQLAARAPSALAPFDAQATPGRLPVVEDDDDPLIEICDDLYWRIDVPTCDAIWKNRGAEAGARCHHTAAARYAACLHGTPLNMLPPLDTWIW